MMMGRRHNFPARFVLVSLFAVTAQAQWSTQLENGGQLQVDPETNRATITRDGVTTQAWDGVHQLEDGTTITIHSGQAVPNEAILRARRPPPPPTDQASAWMGTPIVGSSPCEQLVQRVCGTGQACEQAPACEPARQLLSMENEERAAGSPDNMTHSSGQCMEALKDRDYFTECRP